MKKKKALEAEIAKEMAMLKAEQIRAIAELQAGK